MTVRASEDEDLVSGFSKVVRSRNPAMDPCVSSSQKACMFAAHPEQYINIASDLNESKTSLHLWKRKCGSHCYQPVVCKEVTYFC